VIALIAVIIHRIGVELFAPESPLHEVASRADNLGGADKADLWFQILAIWGPLFVLGFAMAFLLIKEYRRQVSTAATARP
jgi:hypothetical protein